MTSESLLPSSFFWSPFPALLPSGPQPKPLSWYFSLAPGICSHGPPRSRTPSPPPLCVIYQTVPKRFLVVFDFYKNKDPLFFFLSPRVHPHLGGNTVLPPLNRSSSFLLILSLPPTTNTFPFRNRLTRLCMYPSKEPPFFFCWFLGFLIPPEDFLGLLV